MSYPFFEAQSLDDLLQALLTELLAHNTRVLATKGSMREITGVLLELHDPRARLSRTETKGQPFSCLGEFCWYVAGSNELDFIVYYLRSYRKYADGNLIHGGYGPRLFNWGGHNQVDNILSLLRRKPTSRQAVIQLFDFSDILASYNDTPCTSTLQFLIRNGVLHMITSMRSNDVFIGLPHDIFAFTMLQELLARALSLDVGPYKHFVGSLHLYDANEREARAYLNEGWQSNVSPMPPMPKGDPWPAVKALRDAEVQIRLGYATPDTSSEMDPYWADLVRLLRVFRHWKDRRPDLIRQERELMASGIYSTFIDKKLHQLLR